MMTVFVTANYDPRRHHPLLILKGKPFLMAYGSEKSHSREQQIYGPPGRRCQSHASSG